MSLRRKKHIVSVFPKTAKHLRHKRKYCWLIWVFPIAGMLSLIWFLIRVIPKPSRATYPCQRVAAPLASAFVVWLAGLISSILAYRKARRYLHQSRYIVAAICVVVSVMAIWWSLSVTGENPASAAFTPSDPPNSPIGVAKGIHPGRVVWLHDPSATSWNGSTGNWWADDNTDQDVVDYMMSKVMRTLTGESNDKDAWEAMFRYSNRARGKGDIGYQAGERIVIKINMNNNGSGNRIDASPQMVRGLLRQLVYGVGVAQSAITVYDAQKTIGAPVSNCCRPEFPDVGYNTNIGWVSNAIRYSAQVTNSAARRLPRCVLDANYMINMAILKRHNLNAAVTLCAKNHFGTIGNPSALHTYIRSWNWPMGSYDPQVDIIGHEDIGGKTVLYIIDGLYGGDRYDATPRKWRSAPFNNDWPSSIFASQDGVAIDSVGMDFLRGEWSLRDNADRYLHEAAQADSPPSGTFYDPEGDGVRLESMGVHEHWNNPVDKQYSRNLGTGEGIELVTPSLTSPDGPIENVTAGKPNPADGATDVPRDVVLSWTPGMFAPPINGHKVYLSENFNGVNDGIGGTAQDANSYAPGRLDFSTTYYWRVDEVNGPPDYTVYEGDVWSFTTELFAYAIENVTATASSAHQAEMGPEKTTDNSGLDDNDLHSIEAADMWLSSTEPLGAWIEYEFDKAYKLHELWVWNSNQTIEFIVGFGAKDVTIEYSTKGTDYTTLGTTHEFARAPGAAGYAHNTTIDFGGAAAKYVKLTANTNWGFLTQYGLSEVRFFYIPIRAREASPDSGATDVDVDVILSWRAGREAAQHDVYLSSDEQAVADGTAAVTTVTETSYGPLSLDLGQTYYWRVDEVNEAETPAMWQGDLWDFTTQEYFAVDDFESYNDLDPTDPESNRIFNTWIDGYGIATNGSLVGYEIPPFCERTIIHGDKQSMPLSYSNTGGAAYSEAERTFTAAQNWTQAGAATLVLYFHGAEGNTGQLYVKVDGSKVVYDGDAGDIAKVEWKQWNIDLASLGIDLQNVTKLSIGIDGNGASGTLYVDDIGLYRLAPERQAN